MWHGDAAASGGTEATVLMIVLRPRDRPFLQKSQITKNTNDSEKYLRLICTLFQNKNFSFPNFREKKKVRLENVPKGSG